MNNPLKNKKFWILMILLGVVNTLLLYKSYTLAFVWAIIAVAYSWTLYKQKGKEIEIPNRNEDDK